MSSTALVPSGNNTALAVAATAGLGGFSISPSGIAMVQKTSQVEGAIPGKFRDRDSGNHFDELTVIPLQFRITRVLFPPLTEGGFGSEPICRSDDGQYPANNAAVPQCTSCANCDNGPKAWNTYKQTKQKPSCQEKLQLMFIDRDTSLPYYITFGGMSVGTMKRIAKSILKDVMVAGKKGIERRIYDYTFKMKPQFIQGPMGSYYVVGVSDLKVVANPGEFGPLFEEFVLKQKEQEADEQVSRAVDAEFTEDQVIEA